MSSPATALEPTQIEAEIEPVIEQWGVIHTPSIAKLVLALAKAQLKYKPVFKQNENEAFTRGMKKSLYADLAAYLDATQEALAENELVVMQWPDVAPEAKSMSLVTILAHSSGEWLKGRITLPAVGRNDFTPQTCGSSITYARRYSYAAITGCAAEDDDANAATGIGSVKAAQAVAQDKIEKAAKQGNKTAQKALESQEQPISEGAALFFAWEDASQTATIMGDEALKSANRDLLKPLYRGELKAIVATADQLEDLKYQFDQRKVPFLQAKTVKK